MYLTQQQACELLGVKPQFITKLAGKREWSIHEFDYTDSIGRRWRKKGYLKRDVEKEVEARKMPVCEYCGMPAMFVLRNGYQCCTPTYNQCPQVVKNNVEAQGFDYASYLNTKQYEQAVASKSIELFQSNYTDLTPVEKRIVVHQVKYGVDHFSKTDLFHRRVLQPEAWNNFKSYTLPSGRIIRIQGWENIAIDYYLSQGLAESDLVTKRSEVPKIILPNGRRYYPDMHIPKQNRIVEVKSPWTWNRDGNDLELENLNKVKRDATRRLGYNFTVFMAWSPKEFELQDYSPL